MGRPFISHDGIDPQGVRAEVVVEEHTGTVKAITELDKVAKIEFVGDGLTRPVGGHIQLDDPVLETLKELKKSKENITYRIEITRKHGIDRSISMATLREGTEEAVKNVNRIIAGINGVLTKEAVTNPAEDVNSGGNYSALNMDPASLPSNKGNRNSVEILANAVKAGLPHEAVSALVATAIYDGADPKEVMAVAYPEEHAPSVVQRVRSREAAVFIKWNLDGSLNLGSSQIIAGVSSENFSRRTLAPIKKSKDFEATVEKYAVIILAIADTIQLNAYNNVGSPDRMAGSHTRIRGVVYDVIENEFPIPALKEGYTSEDDFTWVSNVGRVAKERFFTAIRISESEFAFSSLRPATATETETVAPEVAVAPVVSDVALPTTKKKATAPVAPDAVVEDVVGDPVEENEDDEDFDFELYDFSVIPDVNPQVPTAKTINALKALFVEFNIKQEDFIKVGDLLEYSFGKRQAKDVPSDDLVKFIDFYKEHGAENLHKAIGQVEGILNGV